jgi:hypothetical protein
MRFEDIKNDSENKTTVLGVIEKMGGNDKLIEAVGINIRNAEKEGITLGTDEFVVAVLGHHAESIGDSEFETLKKIINGMTDEMIKLKGHDIEYNLDQKKLKESDLPFILSGYFKDKTEFIGRVKSAYKKLRIKNKNDDIKIDNDFIKALLGEKESSDFSPEE